MDTKWKSRIIVLAWFIVFTYGISGMFALMDASRFLRGTERDLLFWFYSIGAVIALFVSIKLEMKNKFFKSVIPSQGQQIYNQIPFDIACILFFISFFVTWAFFSDPFHLYYSSYIPLILERITFHLLTVAFLFGCTIIQGAYLYPRLKDFESIRKDWDRSLTLKVLQSFRDAFMNRRVGTQIFMAFSIVFMFGAGIVLVGIEEQIIVLYIPAVLLIGLPLFIFIVRRTGYFNRILQTSRALARGEYAADLPIKGKSALAKLAEDINQLKQGISTSQKAQAKSERLKTELITNVSHDLRTPLTSIMTYTELLKKENVTEDERKSYVEIIDRKSKRLKVLIDDLFEASKMASGNIELSIEKVDIVQLLQQALAEYNETIQESSIQFRVSTPNKPVYAMVDGQKLWRVFDNLIGNMLKYSLDHTRAYIDIKADTIQTTLTFKNISEYELSDNIDELFERFKRGDESRHTDGSGLGLAIAKSIIDLHEGSLDIDVDGDLFKVTIQLALMN